MAQFSEMFTCFGDDVSVNEQLNKYLHSYPEYKVVTMSYCAWTDSYCHEKLIVVFEEKECKETDDSDMPF